MKRALLLSIFVAAAAHATTREATLVHARTFANHPWSAATANLTASCNSAYNSVYTTGDFVGLPYDWGGYMTLSEFDTQIAAGYGAGSYPDDGVLACTSGLDCSGFVSQCWESGHYTTSSIPGATSSVATGAMLPGDVFNQAGYHVAMYAQTMASGEPLLYEAIGYNVRVNSTGGFSHVDGYLPRRYALTGTTDTNPVGTATNPIVVGSLPYTDTRDTKASSSKVFDACGAAATIDQKGPEYVYAVTITQPGTLTASVTDDATTDIDVQLYEQLNLGGCVTRNDKTLSYTVGCGTYYVVADTFKTSAGSYTLSVSLAPNGKTCGQVAGPKGFAPGGKLGEACQNPNNPSAPFCNPNLGGDVCIYTAKASQCSKPCSDVSDCADLPGTPCCDDIGSGEKYCLTGTMCSGGGSVTPDDGGAVGDPTDDLGGTTDPVDMKKPSPDLKKPVDFAGLDLTGVDLTEAPVETDDAGTIDLPQPKAKGCAVAGDASSSLFTMLTMALVLLALVPLRRRARSR